MELIIVLKQHEHAVNNILIAQLTGDDA